MDHPQTTDTYIVFVYGTLKRGYKNYYQMEGATFLSTAVTVDKYYMTSTSHPYLSKSKQHSIIQGECFRVDKETLARLDQFEGVPNYYVRETIKVVMNDTKEVKDVEVYFCERVGGMKVHDDGLYVE